MRNTSFETPRPVPSKDVSFPAFRSCVHASSHATQQAACTTVSSTQAPDRCVSTARGSRPSATVRRSHASFLRFRASRSVLLFSCTRFTHLQNVCGSSRRREAAMRVALHVHSRAHEMATLGHHHKHRSGDRVHDPQRIVRCFMQILVGSWSYGSMAGWERGFENVVVGVSREFLLDGGSMWTMDLSTFRTRSKRRLDCTSWMVSMFNSSIHNAGCGRM